MMKSTRKAPKPARSRTARHRPPCGETVDVGFEVSKLVAAAVDAVKLPQEEERPPGREQAGPQAPSVPDGKT